MITTPGSAMTFDPTTALAAHRLTKGVRPVAARYLARRFPAEAKVRVVIYHDPNRISYAQIYPFLHYHRQLRDRYGADIRCLPFSTLLDGPTRPDLRANVVLIQPWFTIAPDDLRKACDQVRLQHPGAILSFVDSYAHNDLRLARHLPDDLAFYLKKCLFADSSAYLQAYRGDTQMMQYYADLYGIAADSVDFATPPAILEKLRLSPNFLTAPHFVKALVGAAPPPFAGRSIDMQTRLGRKGGPIYAAMRDASLAAVRNIVGITSSPEAPVPYTAYMAEMAQSRLCFSPFGFGELCWRDIEAIQTGAVMIKPDMSHLNTLPDLYEAGVTYLPVAWDFSDLEDVVRDALANPALCHRITQTAWDRAKTYLDDARFVDDMAFLFSAQSGKTAQTSHPET